MIADKFVLDFSLRYQKDSSKASGYKLMLDRALFVDDTKNEYIFDKQHYLKPKFADANTKHPIDTIKLQKKLDS